MLHPGFALSIYGRLLNYELAMRAAFLARLSVVFSEASDTLTKEVANSEFDMLRVAGSTTMYGELI